MRLQFNPRYWRGCLWSLLAAVLTMSGTLLAATHTWTGTNSSVWSDPLNWIGGAPQPGELPPVELIIPSSAAGFRDLTNDVAGLTVNTLTIAAHANVLHALPGVVLTLRDGTLAGLGTATILESSFHLRLEGTNQLHGQTDFVVRGAVTESGPGATLKISGHVRLEASSAHTGPTYLTNGVIELYGPMTNTAFLEVAADAELTLAADFTVLTNRGLLHVLPGTMQRPDTSRLFGQGLVCAPESTLAVQMIDYPALDSDDPADGGRAHTRLVIDGPVVLAGRLQASTDLLQAGLRFGIIENVGGLPTLGRFDELPEGALMNVAFAGLLTQRISYHGGAGKDVTATFVLPPAGRQLRGPFMLENGWLQILAGIAEFDYGRKHRWEANTNLTDTNGWTALGPDFLPGDSGTLLTITNASAFPRRFFRLTAL